MRKAEQVLELIRETGIVRPRDLEARGISRAYLRELVEAGLVMRSGRGTYFVVDGAITEKHSLAEVCQRVPHGV
ncbi:MAG: type IV toxin-antitoxin system AbiEi family antitoxin domain-containing protein, partial [Armatimonadetes bacterium]|nr:type IV toxin-antitoxin system AbiEi family antitoxin domain-containing protein [Armatimonadota bacterium]